jgi:hypothetical protein
VLDKEGLVSCKVLSQNLLRGTDMSESLRNSSKETRILNKRPMKFSLSRCRVVWITANYYCSV